MIVALFVSFNMNHFYPKVVIAVMCFLQKIGCPVGFLMNQIYFGQPIAKPAFASLATEYDIKFIENFNGYDYIAALSGCCLLHIKNTDAMMKRLLTKIKPAHMY